MGSFSINFFVATQKSAENEFLTNFRLILLKVQTFSPTYEYVFIISGVIGLLGAWMEGNYPISARKFSEMVLKMGLKAAEIEKSDFR